MSIAIQSINRDLQLLPFKSEFMLLSALLPGVTNFAQILIVKILQLLD